MSDDSVQNFANHARWLKPWHFFVLPVFLINAIVSLVTLAKGPSLGTLWASLVAVALAVAVLFCRWMPLQVQDRVIRLEETLRLERLLPGRYTDFEKLTRGQLIGLRFASDAEVPHLVDRILSGEITTRKDIKMAVQHWRPDHMRA
jgi:hypothetical protein